MYAEEKYQFQQNTFCLHALILLVVLKLESCVKRNFNILILSTLPIKIQYITLAFQGNAVLNIK